MLNRYLTKRPRSSLWQLRVPVPKDVQQQYGRKVVTKSLGEHDRDRAAKAALPIITALDEEWQRLRERMAQGNAGGDQISPSEADMLAMAWNVFEQSQAAVIKRRSAAYKSDPASYADYRERENQTQVGLVRELSGQDLRRWEEATERVLSNRGYKVDRESDEFRNFTAMVAEATVAGIDVENRRERGELAAQPSSKILERAFAAKTDTGLVDLPFSSLVDTYMQMWRADRGKTKDTNTEQQKLATFNLFAGHWQDKPIRGITGKDAAEFRDKLKLLHPDWSRSPASRKLAWAELHAAFGNHATGLSASTMNRHMAALKSLWDWARKRGHCDGENPFDGFRKKIRLGENSHSYLPWEADELKGLLEPPPKRSDLLEVMIVGMFTGMRLDEIASLTWDKVRTVTDGNQVISYFQIDDAKTPAGIRQVPLHAELNWLLKRREGKGNSRIWPKFNLEGPSKKAGADASREFSHFKKSRGFDSRRKTFHSFRKNVTRIMERAGVPENEWAQVFGHERGFTYSVYNPDGITMTRKAEIISLISYPKVSVPHPPK